MKDLNSKTMYFYCWLCEKQKCYQELMIVSKGRRFEEEPTPGNGVVVIEGNEITEEGNKETNEQI